MSSPPDRNLLFGILALQLDFITKDALLEAMNARVLNDSKSLGEVLRDAGQLTTERLKLLTTLLAEHLRQHNNDPVQSLAALSTMESTLRQQLAAMPDVQATVSHVGGTIAKEIIDQPSTVLPAAERYRILKSHARGGLGEVFIAEDTELGRQVALKEIQSRYAADKSSRRRFVLEAEITGGLEHPGIVPVYGLGAHADGRPFYAMRFIKGNNLKDAIARFHSELPDSVRGSFDSLEFRGLLRRFVDVCNAVAYAHSRGILHRDLKPGNIMLGKYGETLVVDWGLAKVVGNRESEHQADADPTLLPRSGGSGSASITGTAMGTPAYMAPEQAQGEIGKLCPASDVYSLGAALYELLTGKPPFESRMLEVVLADVQAGRFPPPRRVLPEVPRGLEAVCLKAMARKPTNRYASPLELAKEIECWLADESVTAWPEPFTYRARRWARKHSRLTTGLAASLLVGAVGFGALAWQREAARKSVEKEQIETAKERDRANGERDVAREQKRRTRAALDTMVSKDMVERLGSQKELTKGQREFLETALGYYREFASEAATDQEGRTLEAVAHFRVGYLFQALGQREEAVAAYRVAIQNYARLVADHPAEFTYQQGLSRTYSNLGILHRELSQRADAEAAYREALAIEKKLAADFPSVPEHRLELAASHNNLGNLLNELSRRFDAEKEFLAAQAIEEKLTQDFPGVPAYRHALAKSQNNLGVMLSDADKRADAEKAYIAAVRIGGQLTTDFPSVPEYRLALASSYENLGLLLSESGRGAEAESAGRTALAIHEKLAADFPSVPEYRIQLGGSYANLGHLLYDVGNPAAAVELHSDAIKLLAPIVAAEPRLAYARQALRNSHWGRADDYVQLKRPAEALIDWERALELDDGSRRTTIRLGRAGCLARLRRTTDAVREASELAADPASNAEMLYGCAGVFAISSADRNNAESNGHAARAIELLAQAIDRGFKAVEKMKTDADLDSLRHREDFKMLIGRLGKDAHNGIRPDPSKPADQPKPPK